MKKTMTCALAVLFVGNGCLSFASKTQNLEPAAEQGETTSIQQSIEKLQQSFSGMVKKTDQGLVLETKNAKYQLKGLSLEEIVGKEVYVTGVVKSDDKTNTIYVVKADVKQ